LHSNLDISAFIQVCFAKVLWVAFSIVSGSLSLLKNPVLYEKNTS
jgi:hypothetical protein